MQAGLQCLTVAALLLSRREADWQVGQNGSQILNPNPKPPPPPKRKQLN